MSIINQTLRELDARKTASQPQAVPVRAAMAAAPRRRLGWWAAGGSALLLVAGGMVWIVSRPALGPAPTQVEAPAHAPPVAARSAAGGASQPATASQAVLGTTTSALPAEPKPIAPETRDEADRPEASSSMALSAELAKPPVIRKEISERTAEEEADEQYRKAVALVKKGREIQARPLLEEAVRLAPGHAAARQMLATLLSEAGEDSEAEAVLRDGRAAIPDNAWFTLGLARLQAARGDTEGAAATLAGGLGAQGVTAEYRATLAALYVRLKRYGESAPHYERALQLQPDEGNWWIGLGLSLEAQGKTAEAHKAYGRALAAGNLPDRLAEFARAKLAK